VSEGILTKAVLDVQDEPSLQVHPIQYVTGQLERDAPNSAVRESTSLWCCCFSYLFSFCKKKKTRFDIIVDASDNVATRYLLNDACVLAGKPLVSGSALRMEGQVSAVCLSHPLASCLSHLIDARS